MYSKKTTDLPQGTDTLYHIILYYYTSTCAGFALTASVLIGTECIGISQYNHHMIETTTLPLPPSPNNGCRQIRGHSIMVVLRFTNSLK